MKSNILTINAGSSSIKFALFSDGEPYAVLLRGKIDRIGLSGSLLEYTDQTGTSTSSEVSVPNAQAAAEVLHTFLQDHVDFDQVKAVGHRIVHGLGRANHELVTPQLISELKAISAIDQEHLPLEISIMETLRQSHPHLIQVACFDTVFHHTLPRVAQLLPLPRRFEAKGVRRYGFHGLSLAYIMQKLRSGDPAGAQGRVIVLHLGSGVSITAIKDGASIDTSMGFTPTGGMVMGSRSGDLGPGALEYIMREENLSFAELNRLVNHESGLLGVSETSSDMYDLLQIEATDVRAKEAIDLFCYEAKKHLGAYAAVLGGVDTVVFTGGMGEKAPLIRSRITDGLGFLGIIVDEARNQAGDERISADSSVVDVKVIPTNEELMMVQITSEMSSQTN